MAADPVQHRLQEALADLPGAEQLLADAAAGAALRDALAAGRTVILHADEGDDEDSTSSVSVTAASEAHGRSTVSRRTLTAALEALVGREPRRACGRCQEPRLASQFSRQARYCKTCERKRVKQYESRRAQRQGREPPAWDVRLPDGTGGRFAGWTKGEARAAAKRALGLERLPPGTAVEPVTPAPPAAPGTPAA